MGRLIFLLLGVCSMLFACTPDRPSAIEKGPYSVIEVFDGDSFNLRSASGATIRIRLAGIDAPEKGQPYSQQSKAALEAGLSKGPLTVEPIKKDQFDRWIATVFINGEDLGLAQIESGMAWFFTRYRHDLSEAMQERYAQAERQAKTARLGLWAWSGPIEPPWKFRERTRKEKSAQHQKINRAFEACLAYLMQRALCVA